MNWHQSVEHTLTWTGLNSMCLLNKLAGKHSLEPQGRVWICQKSRGMQILFYDIIQIKETERNHFFAHKTLFLSGKGLNFLGGKLEKLFPWVTGYPKMWKPQDKHIVHEMAWLPLPTGAAPATVFHPNIGKIKTWTDNKRIVAFNPAMRAAPGLCCHRDSCSPIVPIPVRHT